MVHINHVQPVQLIRRDYSTVNCVPSAILSAVSLLINRTSVFMQKALKFSMLADCQSKSAWSVGSSAEHLIRRLFGVVKTGTVLLLICAMLTGCGGNKKESITKPKPPLKLKFITLAMEWEANDNSPTPVELVRVKDASLVQTLLAIKPKDWFETEGTNFRQSHPGAYFDLWEVVPGTSVGPLKVKVKGRVAGVLFCGLAESTSAFRVERNGRILVNLGREGCSVEKGTKPKK